MEVNKLDLEGVLWTYRGEGNANIVIGLDNELRVLRLSKSTKLHQDRSDANGANESDLQEVVRRHQDRLRREMDRANNIVKRLVGPELLGTVEIVEISEEQIALLNEKLNLIRPKNRLHKEIGFVQGTLRPDFARIHPTTLDQTDYCVEIKLKQGWFNTTSELAQERSYCNFCIRQCLKLKQGKITQRSNYCPLDIFSGVPDRMVSALIALLQNPQNNLRIFKGGDLVFGDDMGILRGFVNQWFEDFKMVEISPSSDRGSDKALPVLYEDKEDIFNSRHLWRFLHVICLALMAPLQDQGINEERAAKSKELFSNFEKNLKKFFEHRGLASLDEDSCKRHACNTSNDNNNALPDCVLSKIIFLQSLSQEEPSSILEVYKKICPTHSQADNGSGDSNSSDLCPSGACFASEVWYDEECMKTRSQSVLTEEEDCRIQNFLISATAKDCSLMIAISNSNEEACASATTDGERESKGDCDDRRMLHLNDLFGGCSYQVKLGLVDMDIKPLTCIPKQCVQDCDMLKSFKEYSANN